jgi:hypothetical protein
MIALLERLLPLWTEPVDERGDPEAAFGQVYTDPVVVNGTEMSLTPRRWAASRRPDATSRSARSTC